MWLAGRFYWLLFLPLLQFPLPGSLSCALLPLLLHTHTHTHTHTHMHRVPLEGSVADCVEVRARRWSHSTRLVRSLFHCRAVQRLRHWNSEICECGLVKLFCALPINETLVNWKKCAEVCYFLLIVRGLTWPVILGFLGYWSWRWLARLWREEG